MNSFFNFLRNNKAYAAIDVFGLSVSFMFVILIGAYVWQETHIGHCHSKADRIYALEFLISLLGLLAISTYYVQQRENEIAVRKVFGSTAAGIIRKVTRAFAVYVMAAFVLAVPIAYHILSDWLSQFSYRIPVYWWLFAVSLVVVIAITVVTVYMQARNAANSNPVDCLKAN